MSYHPVCGLEACLRVYPAGFLPRTLPFRLHFRTSCLAQPAILNLPKCTRPLRTSRKRSLSSGEISVRCPTEGLAGKRGFRFRHNQSLPLDAPLYCCGKPAAHDFWKVFQKNAVKSRDVSKSGRDQSKWAFSNCHHSSVINQLRVSDTSTTDTAIAQPFLGYEDTFVNH